MRIRPAVRCAAAITAVAVTVLGAGCSSAGRGVSSVGQPAATGSAGGTGAAPATLGAYDAQRLRWAPCSGGFECARLLVPVDYRHPAGQRFSLPVIRLPAAGPAHRIGALVLNPGGPGGSGVAFARQARSVVSAAVRARFDVVGFDPRGVGGSRPAIRCMTGPQLDQYVQTDDTPQGAAEMSALVSSSRFFALACGRQAGALLPFVGTDNAARDMDVLRSALGDARLTYLGKSYGTYLGTYYAQLFPHNVRALVLDGAIDPAESAIEQDIVQAQGFQVAFAAFAADCVVRAGCPLSSASLAGAAGGASHAAAVAAAVRAGTAKLAALLNQADQTPLANDLGDGRPANEALVAGGVLAALYSKDYWPLLRQGLQDAFTGDGTLLIELSDALLERNRNGTYSNLAEANMAVNCVDRPWPRDLAAWRAAAATASRAAPEFGSMILWGSLPCAYWPVPGARVPQLRADGAPPILVVGTTRDPATPYRWARALAGDLSSGVLLGWNGDGHTAYMMGSSCVDAIVDRYLIDGTGPAGGTVCP